MRVASAGANDWLGLAFFSLAKLAVELLVAALAY
jgi:hypothetical protein